MEMLNERRINESLSTLGMVGGKLPNKNQLRQMREAAANLVTAIDTVMDTTTVNTKATANRSASTTTSTTDDFLKIVEFMSGVKSEDVTARAEVKHEEVEIVETVVAEIVEDGQVEELARVANEVVNEAYNNPTRIIRDEEPDYDDVNLMINLINRKRR